MGKLDAINWATSFRCFLNLKDARFSSQRHLLAIIIGYYFPDTKHLAKGSFVGPQLAFRLF
ncbi:hypothetical protein FOWG_18207 [Fusarium oxysporum f. sp. lycopersici MN25]|nr:hypothetical protein FOWG_18207 [Fusarium oxysporum f. sp. lycopersici MN25]